MNALRLAPVGRDRGAGRLEEGRWLEVGAGVCAEFGHLVS